MVMWWRRRSLRARLTLATSAGLALALALAAVLLVSALHASLVRDLDVSARQGAVEVAALLDQNRLPSPVPVAPGTLTIQVLDATGRITNISPGADRLVPMLPLAQARAAARTGQARTLAGPPLGLPSMLRVVAVGAAGHHVVISAISYTQASDSLATLARVLAIGTPLLFALLALVTWLLTGYTLRPIAALRRGAAEVTQTGVPRDLPVPPARDEVRLLAVTLNDMLSRLAEAQQRQRDLVSDTAHELRSPIASIRAQLEVALDHPDGLDWAETARDVHADTLRLARLTEDLLLLARLDGQHLRRTPTDLAAVCESVAARYATARVPVRAETAGACVVAGDADALARLLVNLRGQPGLCVGVGGRRVGGAGRDRRRAWDRARRCRTGLRSLRSARRRTQPVRGRRRRAGPGHREVDRGSPRRLGVPRRRRARPARGGQAAAGSLSRGFGERGEAAQRLLDELMLSVQPAGLALGQADGYVDGGAGARLGELPDELDVGDLAGDRDPLVRLVHPQLLRHREVRVTRRPQRELAGRAGPYGLDARPPLGKPRRVEQQLPHFLDGRAALRAQRESRHNGTSVSSSNSSSSAVRRRSSQSGSTRPTIGGRPRSTKLATNSAPGSCPR